MRGNSASFNKSGSGKNSPARKIKYVPDYKDPNNIEDVKNPYVNIEDTKGKKDDDQAFILAADQGDQNIPK